jgi:hypothetical protein
MSAGASLRAAMGDLYRQSWRLVVVNSALGAGLVGAVYAALFLPVAGALVVVLVLGPLAAALAHCAVTVVRTEELRLADAVAGLRLHWRRGLVLAVAAVATVWLAFVAIRFYAGSPAWPLAFLAGYLAVAAGVVQLLLWPLAISRPQAPLRALAREALVRAVRRPAGTLGLAAVLVAVNVAGIAAAVLPFLTMTVAYSFVAAAHFTLEPAPEVPLG